MKYIFCCLICKEDLGPTNPRQLCCKTYCPWEGIELAVEVESTEEANENEQENCKKRKAKEDQNDPSFRALN